MAQQKEENRDGLRNLDLVEGLLEHELDEGWPPHEHAGSQGQPLVVRDWLVLRVPATRKVREVRGTSVNNS